MLAPKYVLDYVVGHEVAHLKEMNHGPKFWKLCRELCAALDQHGARMAFEEHGTELYRYGRLVYFRDSPPRKLDRRAYGPAVSFGVRWGGPLVRRFRFEQGAESRYTQGFPAACASPFHDQVRAFSPAADRARVIVYAMVVGHSLVHAGRRCSITGAAAIRC